MTPVERTLKLRRLMDSNGLSPEDVSSMTHRTVETIYHWRSGKRWPIPQAMLDLIELKTQQGGSCK